MANEAMFDLQEYYRTYSREEHEIDLRSYLLPEEGLAWKIASGHYPTPMALAELQLKHGQGPKDPHATDVEPFPPRRRKNEIFDAAKYTEKDEYVKTLIPQSNESEGDFAARLFQMSSSNLDKVRAAFYFLCTVSVDRMTELELESPIYAMIRQLRKQDNVNGAFRLLLELAGVPFKCITGFKKGASYENGFEAVEDGSEWFACYVEGEWRLVDVFWGSQAVSGFDTGNFAKVNSGSFVSALKSPGEVVYECNELYFLTNPETFILNHFPHGSLSYWQLLVRPLTLAQFNQMPKFFAGYSEEIHGCSVIPQSHPLNVIVSAPGILQIYLTETGRESYEYMTEIQIHRNSVNKEVQSAIKQHSDVRRFISKMLRLSKTQVMFRFVPPCPGKFLLRILILRTVLYPEKKLMLTTTAEYVSYVIHCPIAVANAKTVPVGSDQLIGFGASMDLDVVEMRTDDPGEMTVVNGEKQLVLESQNLRRVHKFECLLVSSDNETISSNNLLIWTSGAKTNIMFLSPNSGSYALIVSDKGKPVCQFLLNAQSEFRECREFPLPDLKKLGGLGFVDDSLTNSISPVSHPDPYVVCEEPSLELTFLTKMPVEIKTELLYIDSSGEEVGMNGYTFVSSGEQGFNVDIRFNMSGHYVLRLYIKHTGTDSWKHCYNYFIRSLGQLDGSASPFPEAGPAWDCGNRLIQPRTGLLPVAESVPFSLQAHDTELKVIYLVNELTNESNMLSQGSDGLWEGRIQGNRQSAGALVKVMGGAEMNSCEELLRYRFESRDDRKNRRLAMHEALKLNRRRAHNERLRQRKQENYMRGEQGIRLLPDIPDEFDYEGLEEATEEKASDEENASTEEAQKGISDEIGPQSPLKQPDAPEELVALAAWLNSVLSGDMECSGYLQFHRDGSDIVGKCCDGVIPCKVINIMTPGTIDERVLHKGHEMSQSQRHQNLTLMLNSAQSLGIPVSVSAAELELNSQSLMVDLLWQIIRLGHLAKVKQAAAVIGSDLRILPPEKLLLQWVNSQLEVSGCRIRIRNFGADIKDSEAYVHLLMQTAPKDVQNDAHQPREILHQQNLLRRAQMVLHNAKLLEVCTFIEPSSIVTGHPDLNLVFVANLFVNFCARAPAAKVRGQPGDRQREEATCVNWMNSLGVQPRISDLYSDLRSGLVYLQLYDTIQPGLVEWQRVHKNFSKIRESFQQLENCNHALALGKEMGFTLIGIGGEDLAKGHEMFTLGLLWQLMRAYTLAVLTQLSVKASGSNVSSKIIDEKSIISWARERLQECGKASGFTSFKDPGLSDARCVLDLIDCLKPGSVDYSIVLAGTNDTERLQNAKLAISLGWRAGARIYALPEDIVEVKPKMMMTVFACLMQLYFQQLGSTPSAGHSS